MEQIKGITYTLKEIHLMAGFMKYSEFENAIGKKFNIPTTEEKPLFKVTIER